MRILFLISFLYLISILNCKDFRECSWGMGIKQIKRIETAKFVPKASKENLLFYHTMLYGFPTYVAYVFNEDGLYKGKYFFINKSADYNEYVMSYEKIETGLISKYGKPVEINKTFNGAFYTSWIIPIGNMEIASKKPSYIFGYTDITLGLIGDSDRINFTLEYEAKRPSKQFINTKRYF